MDGAKLLGEDRSDGIKIRYFYDNTGICGFSYNGKVYSYVKDLFGNVVMLMDYDIPVARYCYDALGNHKVLNLNGSENTSHSFIGNINPIRWKSHYYDVESGYYYISGRYYDKEIGKYLDADDIENIVDDIYSVLGLDRNGILCDNILELGIYAYTIPTTIALSPVPSYHEPNWFEKALKAVFNCWNNIHWGWKLGIGIAAFILAIALTIISHGSLTPLMLDLMLTMEFGVVNGIMEGAQSGNIGEGILNAVAGGLFWLGIFSLISTGERLIKIWKATKTSRNAAINRAKTLQKLSGEKPTMTAAAVDVDTGNIYYGDSGSISKNINSVLQDKMPVITRTKWQVANCAEFNAVNNALNASASMSNLVVTTVRVKTLVLTPRCFNCQVSLQGVLLVVSG